jgi:hypothetical protein
MAMLVTLHEAELRTTAGQEAARQAVDWLHENDVAVWATVVVEDGTKDVGRRMTAEAPVIQHPLSDADARLGALLRELDCEFVEFSLPPGSPFVPAPSSFYKPYYLRPEFAELRLWAKIQAEDPKLAKFLQLFNPGAMRTARDRIREGFLKTTWTTLLNRFCVPETAEEWAALLALAKPLVNTSLGEQFPTFSATVGLDTDLGRLLLRLFNGEVQGLATADSAADVTFALDNETLRALLLGLSAAPDMTLLAAYAGGSRQAAEDFTRYVRAWQSFLRPRCACGLAVGSGE